MIIVFAWYYLMCTIEKTFDCLHMRMMLLNTYTKEEKMGILNETNDLLVNIERYDV